MITIEQASDTHLDELSNLFDQYRVFYKKPTDITGAKDFLHERIKKEESVIYVAFHEHKTMIGFTQLYPLFSSTRMKRLWLLNDLFVHPDHRGKGVSVALIERAKELCKQTKGCGLMLETAKTNDIGNNLYPRAGFTLDNEHNYYSWDV